MKYEFHIGDYVETKDGRIGYIKNIFPSTDLEPPCINWVTNDGESFFYPIYSWTHCYDVKNVFNRIGQYDFAKSEQSKEIERLSDDLLARFELPDGKAMIMKTYTDSKDFVEASYSRELIDKINELVDAVNELREVKNDKPIS